MLNRKGFTLIELLIVLVIISILAMFAIPKLSAVRGRTYTTAMKSDLKNLQISEEAVYADNQTYVFTGGSTGPAPILPLSFSPTKDNVVLLSGAANGWSATVTRLAGDASVTSCSSWGGDSIAAAPALPGPEGVPVCTTVVPVP